MITLDKWRARMRADLQLRDYGERTRDAYELATRLFLDWAKTAPQELTEEHVRAYFLFLREQKKQAPSSINVAVCALRFFCIHTPCARTGPCSSSCASTSTRSAFVSTKACVSRPPTSMPTA